MTDRLNIHRLTTETRNPQTASIHQADTMEILRIINEEDFKVAEAVQQVFARYSDCRSIRPSVLTAKRQADLCGSGHKRQTRCTGCG